MMAVVAPDLILVTGATGEQMLHVPQSGTQTPGLVPQLQPVSTMHTFPLGQSADDTHVHTSSQNMFCPHALPPSAVTKQ